MRLAALIAAAALLTACETLPPCTECPLVSGKYIATSPLVPVEESTCGELFVLARQSEITLAQEGSALVVTDPLADDFSLRLQGTLYDGLFAQFDPVNTITGDGHGLRMTVSGIFSGEEGAWTLNGSMKLEQTGEPCELVIPLLWTQVPAVSELPL